MSGLAGAIKMYLFGMLQTSNVLQKAKNRSVLSKEELEAFLSPIQNIWHKTTSTNLLSTRGLRPYAKENAKALHRNFPTMNESSVFVLSSDTKGELGSFIIQWWRRAERICKTRLHSMLQEAAPPSSWFWSKKADEHSCVMYLTVASSVYARASFNTSKLKKRNKCEILMIANNYDIVLYWFV